MNRFHLRALALGGLLLGGQLVVSCTHYKVVKDGELNDQALRKVEERTAKVRGLPFKEPVEAEVKTKKKSGEFFAGAAAGDEAGETGDTKNEPSAQEQAAQERDRRDDMVAHRLGMLPDGVSLRELFKRALTNNAAGVYQPPKPGKQGVEGEGAKPKSRGRLFIVEDALPRPVRALVGGFGYLTGTDWANELFLSHELTHALQDQHFDLQRVLPRGLYGENEDMAIARKSVVESEANLVSQAYLLGVDLDSMVQRNALIEYLAFGRFLDTWTTRLMNPDLPAFYVKVLVEQYTQGMRFLQYVTNRGGWEAVNKAYSSSLPLSTEQLMDPDKLFGPHPDLPRSLAKIDAGYTPEALLGWKLIEENVLGALLWRIYLEDYTPEASQIADGWGGDRYEVLEKEGQTLLVWRTLWDSDEDAREFAEGYAAVLHGKYPGRVVVHERDQGTVAYRVSPKEGDRSEPGVRTHGPEIAVIAHVGDRVLVLEGAPTSSWRQLTKALLLRVYEDPSSAPVVAAGPVLDASASAAAKETRMILKSRAAPLRERVFMPHHRMVFRAGIGLGFDVQARDGVLVQLVPDREYRWGFRQHLEWTPPYLLSLALVDNERLQTVVTSGFADLSLGFGDAGLFIRAQPVLLLTQAFHFGQRSVRPDAPWGGFGGGVSAAAILQLGLEGDVRSDGITPPQATVHGGGSLLLAAGDRLVLSAGVAYRSRYAILHPLLPPSLVEPVVVVGAAGSRGRTTQPTIELRLYDGFTLFESSQFFIDPVRQEFLGSRHVLGFLLYF